MKYTLSLILIMAPYFHFINFGMAKATRTISSTAPILPKRELNQNETNSSDQDAEINCVISSLGNHRVTPRNVSSSTWDRIRIYVGADLTDDQTDMITQTIGNIAQAACIGLDVYYDIDRPEGDYINITTAGNGCWADLGRIGGEQTFNLATHCLTHSNVLRAILLSLGIHYQHSRGDRDDFVTIHWENIMDEYKFAFQKEPWGPVETFELPYDTQSLMHYDSFAFSKNGSPTITKKDGSLIPVNEVLTDFDQYVLGNMYYDCDE